jgi:hypothetical protein
MGVGRCGGSSAPGGRVTHVRVWYFETRPRSAAVGSPILEGTRYFSGITRKGGKTVHVRYYASWQGFWSLGLMDEIENCRKKEMTLVLKLNYLRFLVSRKITISSQGGYFRDSVLLSVASYL